MSSKLPPAASTHTRSSHRGTSRKLSRTTAWAAVTTSRWASLMKARKSKRSVGRHKRRNSLQGHARSGEEEWNG
eukprot:scaffold160004_cov18-Tisochrysis_lutea.AAC.3